LTGIFPKSRNQVVETIPLELVKCMEKENSSNCGLLQLKHTGDIHQFYGENYGYKSGLNRSMVAHLHKKVQQICNQYSLIPGDLVIDIGSNDSTTLQAYPKHLTLVGIDPTGVKFKDNYPTHIRLIPDFFSASVVESTFPGCKAKVVTSFSMFYDLEDPMGFMHQIHKILADDGVWVFEQSYMPLMIQRDSYDTICHEHLEYYGLKQIYWMTQRVGLKILDIEFNDVNGGSFSITAAKNESKYPANLKQIEDILSQEKAEGYSTPRPFEAFRNRTHEHRVVIQKFFREAQVSRKKVLGYGASTKGNVLLQWCQLSEGLLPAIAEVNPDKFGSFTPGTLIPIISEEEAKSRKPDYLFVLPWHFKENILSREIQLRKTGVQFVFPLPKLDIV
ncbi:MAG: methyltransferase domain-containing protein, partial [Bdellovibrionia bacterium]